MDEPASVQCPWCFEVVELYVDPETAGSLIEDCPVCCHPWQVHVERGEDGEPAVTVTRAG